MPTRMLQNKEVTQIIAAMLPEIAAQIVNGEPIIARLQQANVKKLKPLLLSLLPAESHHERLLIEQSNQAQWASIAQALLVQSFAIKAIDYLKQHHADEIRRGKLEDNTISTLTQMACTVLPQSGNTVGDMVTQTALFASFYAIAGIALSSSDSIDQMMHNESIAANTAALSTTMVTLIAIGFIAGSAATGGLLPLGVTATAITIGATLIAGATAMHLIKQGGLMLETAIDKETFSTYNANFKLSDKQIALYVKQGFDESAIQGLVMKLAMVHDASLGERTVLEWMSASETLTSARCKEIMRELSCGKANINEIERFLETHQVMQDSGHGRALTEPSTEDPSPSSPSL